jgi:hypothetical protein
MPRRQAIQMVSRVMLDDLPLAAEVGEANCDAPLVAGTLEAREQNRQEQSDDSDDDQQLNQGESNRASRMMRLEQPWIHAGIFCGSGAKRNENRARRVASRGVRI